MHVNTLGITRSPRTAEDRDSTALQVYAFDSGKEVNREHAFGCSAQFLGGPPTNGDDSLDRMLLRYLLVDNDIASMCADEKELLGLTLANPSRFELVYLMP